jgi:hypothetical protein
VRTAAIALAIHCSASDSHTAGAAAPAALGGDPVATLIAENCTSCHSGTKPEAGLAIDGLSPDMGVAGEKWLKVRKRLLDGSMPPAGEAKPSPESVAAAAQAIAARVTEHQVRQSQTVGRTPIRRLNRTQYENTLGDLLGVRVAVKEILPEDALVDGFDTVAEGLRLSPLHMEKYLEAADTALAAAIQLSGKPETKQQRFEFAKQEGIRRNIDQNPGRAICLDIPGGAVLFGDASYITKIFGFYPQVAGQYRIRIRGGAHQSKKPVVMRIHAGSYRMGTTRILGYFDMPAGERREVEVTARLEEGEYLYPAPDDLEAAPDGRGIYQVGAKEYQGSGLALEWIEIEGPLVDAWPPLSVAKVYGNLSVEPLPENRRNRWDRRQPAYTVTSKDPQGDAARVIADFAARAFRRPLEPGEADRFTALAHALLDEGSSLDEALRVGLRGVLTAPQFLLLEERAGPLDAYALASRLSYFLWSTMPDDGLLRAAADGSLTSPEVLRREVERMLADPKAAALTENFVGQWLELRSIDATSPDRRLYPEFDELLKLSMIEETERFFDETLRNDLSAANFIDSDFAILNRRLAEHYGLADVAGEQFRKVKLPPNSPRGGVLTQASVLKVTANGTTTSPVMRGSWVLKHLLDEAPDPPPANVGSIEPDTRGATTIRDQLAKHRNTAACAACHKAIDPPGFALERFDVIGGERDRYRSQGTGDRPTYTLRGRPIHEYRLGLAVDASGELADGRKFAGIDDYKQFLLGDRRKIARALAKNLITFATGSSTRFADEAEVEQILDRAAASDYGVRTLVHEVVQSRLFREK